MPSLVAHSNVSTSTSSWFRCGSASLYDWLVANRRCCAGLPQQVWHHTSVRSRSPLTVLLKISTKNSTPQLRAAAALDADQMDVRLLHLNDRAAGAGELEQLVAHRGADVANQLFLVGVVVVADRGADQLRRDGAELHRPRGHPLRDLPQRRVLQRTALDLADAARHHAALHHLEDDVALRGAAVSLARP